MRYRSIAAAFAFVFCAAAWGVASIPSDAAANEATALETREECEDRCHREYDAKMRDCRKEAAARAFGFPVPDSGLPPTP